MNSSRLWAGPFKVEGFRVWTIGPFSLRALLFHVKRALFLVFASDRRIIAPLLLFAGFLPDVVPGLL